VLVDMAPRVLPTFSEDLSQPQNNDCKNWALMCAWVTALTVSTRTASWSRENGSSARRSSGPPASHRLHAGKWLNVDTDRAGRVRVEPDLSVPGHPEIFVVGDTASLDQNGKPLPGVAQVAIQQGRYAGKLIHNRIVGKPTPKPFKYFDKGSMAVVGKGFAVLQTGKVHLSGFSAWLAWVAVHLQFLATSRLRVSVFVQWVWTYVTGRRGSRLIVNHQGSDTGTRPAEAPLRAAGAAK
jgi:NADH:ubiquinone reductase (H+-translocating)